MIETAAHKNRNILSPAGDTLCMIKSGKEILRKSPPVSLHSYRPFFFVNLGDQMSVSNLRKPWLRNLQTPLSLKL